MPQRRPQHRLRTAALDLVVASVFILGPAAVLAAPPAAAQGLLGIFGEDDEGDKAKEEKTAPGEETNEDGEGWLFGLFGGGEEDDEEVEKQDHGLTGHPSIHPAPSLEGGWRVKWNGADGLAGLIKLSKGLNFECWDNPDGKGCWSEVRRDPEADWETAIVAGREEGDWDEYGTYFGGKRPFVRPSEDGVDLTYPISLLGKWAAGSSLRRVGPDSLLGRWEYGERKGTETWVRAKPRVTHVKFISDKFESRVRSGEPGLVKTRYQGAGIVNMRGARPSFRILLSGEDLWAWRDFWIDRQSGLEIGDDAAYICADGSSWRFWRNNWRYCFRDGRGGLATIQLGVNVWDWAAPGPKTLYFQGQAIPFMLEVRNWPEPVEPALPDRLAAVSMTGEAIDGVVPGETFRLKADFEDARDAEWIAAEAAWDAALRIDGALGADASEGADPPSARRRTIVLKRERDGKTYLSEPLALFPKTSSAQEETTSGAQNALEQFAGVWRVGHMDLDGREVARGEAVLGGDSDGASLSLTQAGDETRYRPVSVRADFFGADARPFRGSVEAVFEPIRPVEPSLLDRAASFLGFGGEDDDVTPTSPGAEAEELVIAEDQEQAVFRSGDATVTLRIEQRNRDDLLYVNVMARESLEQMTGSWRLGEGDGRTTEGEASWIKGEPRIEGIIVLDDQTAMPEARYPFAENARGSIKERTLVVYGSNLPDEAGQATVLSESPGVDYAEVGPFRTAGYSQASVASPLNALEQRGVKNPESYETLALTALLEEGAAPGRQLMTIEGMPATWPLAFADQTASFSFTRENGDETEVFYPGDLGYIELAYAIDMPLDLVNIQLFSGSGDNTDEIGVLTAERVEDAGEPVYRAGPVHFADHANEQRRPPKDSEAIVLTVQAEDRFEAALLDNAKAWAVPPRAKAQVAKSPNALGPTWRDALLRVAKCEGETAEATADLDAYQRETSETISRTILTELGDRSVALTNGDHAAAILIRDEFVGMTTNEVLPELRRIGSSRDSVAAFLDAAAGGDAAAASAPLWTIRKARFERRDGETVEFALKNALDVEGLAKNHGRPISEVREWAVSETERALRQQVLETAEAVRRARGAGDCNIEELLVLAGQRVDPVVARILPRLVKEKTEGDPPRTYWTADAAARGYVKNLHITGAAIRELERYAQIDDSYKAMALAAATAGAAGIVTGVSGTANTGAWIMLAGDAADTAYFGVKGVREYLEAEETYAYAMGAAPTTGEDFLDEALTDRQSGLMASVGVIAPGIGGLSGLRQLQDLRSIGRGRQLLTGGNDPLNQLNRLSDAERTDLAAYYTDLARRAEKPRASGGLNRADRAAYERFQQYFNEAPASNATRRVEAEPADVDVSGDTAVLTDAGKEAKPPVRPSQLPPGERQDYHDAIARQEAERRFAAGEGKETGDDVLDAPPEPNFAPASPEELAELHVPGRDLTAEEILRKAQAYRERERVKNALEAARRDGRPRSEIDALEARFEQIDDALAQAVEEGRALARNRSGGLPTEPGRSTVPSEAPTVRTGPEAEAPTVRSEAPTVRSRVPKATDDTLLDPQTGTVIRRRAAPTGTDELRDGPGLSETGKPARPTSEPAEETLDVADRAAVPSTARLPGSRQPTGPPGGLSRPGGLAGLEENARNPFVRVDTDEPISFDFGERLGQGAGAAAFAHSEDGMVYRVTRLFDAQGNRDLFAATLDNRGREILDSVTEESGGLIRVAQRRDDPLIVRDGDGLEYQVEVVERIEETARQQLTRQGGTMTDGQARALDAAVRYLNRRGYVWTDNHVGNFRFRPAGDGGADRWMIEVLDTGGFFPAKGSTAQERFVSARAVQMAFNAPPEQFVAALRALDRNIDNARRAGQESQLRTLRTARGNLLQRRMRDIMESNDDRIDYDAVFAGSGDSGGLLGAPASMVQFDELRTLTGMSAEEADAAFLAAYGFRIPADAPRIAQ